MAEFVVRLIGAAIEALLEALVVHTGKTVLSFRKVKSHAALEAVVGFVVWVLIAAVLIRSGAAFFPKP